MALGSWQGLYNAVIDELMGEQREQELLLLMAIARYADRFGFAFPGRANLMARRRVSQAVYERRLAFLEDRGYVKMTEGEDPFRRQKLFLFQVSPRVLYVREELQQYCEAIFDGERERSYALENWFTENLLNGNDSLENHSRTNDSQPESFNQNQNPEPGSTSITQTHNQRGKNALRQEQRNGSTTGNAPQGEAPKHQRRKAQTRKPNPQAGGDEFEALLSPTIDDDRIVQEILHIVPTTEEQARDAVAMYTRDSIVYWMRKAAHRRQNGTLSNPGGWFFASLKKHGHHIDKPGPNGQSTYQDWENGPDTDQDMEV